MKQKTIPRYLLGLGVLVAIVMMATTLDENRGKNNEDSVS